MPLCSREQILCQPQEGSYSLTLSDWLECSSQRKSGTHTGAKHIHWYSHVHKQSHTDTQKYLGIFSSDPLFHQWEMSESGIHSVFLTPLWTKWSPRWLINAYRRKVSCTHLQPPSSSQSYPAGFNGACLGTGEGMPCCSVTTSFLRDLMSHWTKGRNIATKSGVQNSRPSPFL